MSRNLKKLLALVTALAMLSALAGAISEGLDVEFDEVPLEQAEWTEEIPVDGERDRAPAEMNAFELPTGEDEGQGKAVYRFIANEAEYAVQEALEGEEILQPEAPEAPEGYVFAGWLLWDGTPLFVDANEDGELDPVIVKADALGTEVYAWAEFEEKAEEAGEEPAEESETEQPGEETPGEEQPEEEGSGEDEQPAEEGSAAVGTSDATLGQRPVSPDGEPASPEGKPFGASAEEEQPAEEPAEAPTDEQPAEQQPAESEEEAPAASQEPSPVGEGGSAEALTDEVLPTDESAADGEQA